MIVKMTKYSILLLTDRKESALEKIQKVFRAYGLVP